MTHSSLQEKLRDILRGRTDLRFPFPYPWDDHTFDEMAGVIEAFLLSKNDVINDSEPLVDWLDSYRFHKASQRRRPTP